MGSGVTGGGGGGSAGQGLRVDTTATAGGGWRRQGKAVKAAAAGVFCFFVLPGGREESGYWRGHATQLPTTMLLSHDFVVILNSYVH